MNPHGFDLELWLFEQGIGASGYVRPCAVWLGSGVVHPVERLRQRIRDAILLRVLDPSAAGVLAALAVGGQAPIEHDEWDLYRATGVAHLMSISGLHLTMFAWLSGAVVGWASRRQPRWMLALPDPTAARWGGLFGAAAYALLAGWGVPAQRTVLMIGAVVLLRTLGRRWPPPLVLRVAAVVVRYTARGVIVLRSDRCGAWSLPAGAGAGTTEGTCERRAAPRCWHHPAGAPAALPDRWPGACNSRPAHCTSGA